MLWKTFHTQVAFKQADYVTNSNTQSVIIKTPDCTDSHKILHRIFTEQKENVITHLC